jgi:hypothetical protein
MNCSCGQIIKLVGGPADGAEIDLEAVEDWDEPTVLYVTYNGLEIELYKNLLAFNPGESYDIYISNLLRGVYYHKQHEIAT